MSSPTVVVESAVECNRDTLDFEGGGHETKSIVVATREGHNQRRGQAQAKIGEGERSIEPGVGSHAPASDPF
jgi:hypothetical protein